MLILISINFSKLKVIAPLIFVKKIRVRLTDHTAIIFTSKNGVDHYFRLAGELRIDTPDSMKYFCSTDTIAFYLQKYIQFRKRQDLLCDTE
jgi:uroporphyrinogen-III synthase